MIGEIQHYRVPLCVPCKRKLEASSEEAADSFLRCEMDRQCVVLSFENAAYAAAFRSLNRGLVFDSVEACLSTRESSEVNDSEGAPSAIPVSGTWNMHSA